MVKRILAVLGIILVVSLVVIAAVLGIIGNPYFMHFTALAMCTPVVLAVLLGIIKYTEKAKDGLDVETTNTKDKESK